MRNCITVLEGCHLGIPLQNNLLDEKMEVIGDNTCMDMDSNRDVASSTFLVLGRPGCVDLAISLYIHVGRRACAKE